MTAPEGPPATPSQPASVNLLNVSGTLPVLVTLIWYSTVWPTSPLSGDVVKPLESPIRWTFSIVNAGSGSIVIETTHGLGLLLDSTLLSLLEFWPPAVICFGSPATPPTWLPCGSHITGQSLCLPGVG